MTTKVLLNYRNKVTSEFLIEYWKTFDGPSQCMHNVFHPYDIIVVEQNENIPYAYAYVVVKVICNLSDKFRMIEVCWNQCYNMKLIHNKINNTNFRPFLSVQRNIDPVDMKKLIEIIEKVGIKNAFDMSEPAYPAMPSIVEFNSNYDHTISFKKDGTECLILSIPYKRLFHEVTNKDTVAPCTMHPFSRQIINKEKTIEDIENDMNQICVNSA